MKNSLAYLNKPYPFIGNIKRDLTSNLLIGLFVAFFLTVFQPFHISEWETNFKILKLSGFGLVSFIAPSCVNVALQYFGKPRGIEEKWNIGYEIFTISIVLLLIAFGNMLYGRILGIMPFGLSAFFVVFSITCLVAIFPVTVHVILKHNKLLSINLQQTVEINNQLGLLKTNIADENHPHQKPETNFHESNLLLELVAENEKDRLKIQANHLLYIESVDNYSEIFYLDADGKQKKELLRSSLKRLETQIQIESIIRCHRRFIVNLNNVKAVGGNAAGYKLYFDKNDNTIPVSRNYIPVVGEKLKAFN